MTPWTAAHQVSLSFTISWSLLKFKEKLKNFKKCIFISVVCIAVYKAKNIFLEHSRSPRKNIFLELFEE